MQNDEPSMVEVVVVNTIVALTATEEQRNAWIEELSALEFEAEYMNHPITPLLDPVHRLLLNQDIEETRDDLAGELAIAWGTILHAVQCKEEAKSLSQFEVGQLFSRQATLKALAKYIQALKWSEAKRIVEEHRSLLLIYRVDTLYGLLMAQSKDDPETARTLKRDYDLLKRCRTEGIDAVFDPLIQASEGTGDQLPEEVLAIVNDLAQLANGGASVISHRISLCRHALSLFSRNQNPRLWGQLQYTLAHCLQEDPLGNRAENLEQAIYHYSQALEVRIRSAFPEEWGMTQNDLALSYYHRIRGQRSENLEQALFHFQQALEVLTREGYPHLWSLSLSNLAVIYLDRMRGERAENIEQAIKLCQQALQVSTRESSPQSWSSLQHNLGLAYLKRVYGERAENLERAIALFQQALLVRTREVFPLDWADTNHNLAVCYHDRIYGERAENLERAIALYQEELEVYTQAQFPAKWAGAQSNLANTYHHRILGVRSENLEQAIYHCQQALLVRTQEAFPNDWALTNSNLASIYLDRQQGERSENIERAIFHCEQALNIQNRQSFPIEWAGTLINLANAYKVRIAGELAENREQAILYYEQTLDVMTRENFPLDWAKTQHNLGDAYRDRILGERGENIELAILYYIEALDVHTLDMLPSDHRRTQHNLGDIFFGEHQWENALTAYRAAIEAGDRLFANSYTDVGRKYEISEISRLYSRAAYCLLKLGQFEHALSTFERGKTRQLVDALSLESADMSDLTEDQQSQLISSRAKIQKLEMEMRLAAFWPNRRDNRVLADLLRQERMSLNSLIGEIRANCPEFLPIGLEISQILALIPEEGALVCPIITSQGSAIFVLEHGVKNVARENVVWLDHFTEEQLQTFIVGSKDKPGWIWNYLYHRGTHEFLSNLDRLVGEIWAPLLATVHQHLQTLKIARLVLIPSNGLQLLPLHAAWYEKDGEKCTLIDDYEITYVPSAYILDVARRRASQRGDGPALVVGIDSYLIASISPLMNAVAEAKSVASFFGAEPLLDDTATVANIKQRAANSAYLHLACHGYFGWTNPLNSGLICYDRPLVLSEIISEFNLQAVRLVTLSACETGITEAARSPDEYIGLPAGFMQAGASAIVSSLWTVDDASTSLLMEKFYQNYKAGMPFPSALREAQLWLRDVSWEGIKDYNKSRLTTRVSTEQSTSNTSPLPSASPPDERPYQNPFYWAAFTFTGAW